MPNPKFAIEVADVARPERSLTPAKIAAAVESPDKGQRIYWIRGGVSLGFGLLVRPPTATRSGLNATWVVQADDPCGRAVRLKIACFGDMPVRDVLTRAIELRTSIQEGTHREQKAVKRATADRNAFTVGDALRLWVEHLEQHARPSTIRDAVGKDGSSGYVRKHLGDWLSKPMAEITKADLIRKHRDIAKGVAERKKSTGERTANKILKALRSAWSCALEIHEDLPPNLLAGRKAFRWNHETQGGPSVPEEDLPQWWTDVHELEPLMRDYYLVCLFTGARAMEVARMRWEHVNLDRGIVHFPDPKGGPRKAFTVPVSSFVHELLRSRAENGSDWVFPSSKNIEKHIVKTRVTDSKRVRTIASPHMLRRTLITAADDLISSKAAEKLVNHGTKSNTAHGRYIIPGEAKLRAASERLTAYILEKAGGIDEDQRDAG